MPLVKTQAEGINLADTFAFTGTVSGAGGIESAQSFRLSQDVNGTGSLQMFDPFEEVDTDYTRVGSVNWTVSSGAFSVAQTGTYLCNYHAQVNNSGAGDAFDLNIQLSTNSGGAYTLRSRCWTYSGSNYENASNTFIFTVSATSGFRLRMVAGMVNAIASTTAILGGSNENQTGITFVKLA
tara:strand:+ start:50 stop:592 length:543 start_codon:yes stop_codon:yes gene_type:complete